jgi:hypothetical protein
VENTYKPAGLLRHGSNHLLKKVLQFRPEVALLSQLWGEKKREKSVI